MLPVRPEGWVCRRCCAFFPNWTYRPPTEKELDDPCAECRKTIDAEERAVEVNRLLLARLSAGSGVLALPVPTVVPTPARRQRKTGAELLSKKEAARRLGVDRATTLEQLIASGHIKTVPFNGRLRIPLAEVERVLNEGIPSMDTARPKARRPVKTVTSPGSESPGAAIRNMKF
ncbi:helix-turn-helix domain-containing protein [Corallococcus exercitus]|uniref:helix-turn-helix domain-containing protein n=1 Tax=Corallococcus exercitus TaxID=2316736 RepID=UPI0035D4A3D5